MIRIAVTAAALVAMTGTPALASNDCNRPQSEWQPREALQKQLEAAGWQVRRNKIDAGCYDAYAIDTNGRKVEVYFAPKTLERVRGNDDD